MRRCLIGFTLLAVGKLAVRSGAEDQSITGYKTPAASAAVAGQAPIKPPETAEIDKPPSDEAVPTLPTRVVLELPHGFVTRNSRGYSFHFAEAPMPEVVESVGRIYRTAMSYSGLATRTISGRFVGRTPEQILLSLVDRTNLKFALDGTVWSVEELGGESPRVVSFRAAIISP